jgi:hypothetical protein
MQLCPARGEPQRHRLQENHGDLDAFSESVRSMRIMAILCYTLMTYSDAAPTGRNGAGAPRVSAASLIGSVRRRADSVGSTICRKSDGSLLGMSRTTRRAIQRQPGDEGISSPPCCPVRSCLGHVHFRRTISRVPEHPRLSMVRKAVECSSFAPFGHGKILLWLRQNVLLFMRAERLMHRVLFSVK